MNFGKVVISGSKLLIATAVVFQILTLFIFPPIFREKYLSINPTGIIGSNVTMDNLPSPVAEPEDKEVFDFEDMIFKANFFLFSPRNLLYVLYLANSNLFSISIRIITPPPQS